MLITAFDVVKTIWCIICAFRKGSSCVFMTLTDMFYKKNKDAITYINTRECSFYTEILGVRAVEEVNRQGGGISSWTQRSNVR